MSWDPRDERDRNYLEYREANSSGRFVRDPFTAVHAIIADKSRTNTERVLAWVKRSAWGNHRLFCVTSKGLPAIQADCAADLKLNKGTVSSALKELKSRGYVRPDSGKLLYPVIDPSPSGPDDSKKVDPVLSNSTFEEECWKIEYASTFEREKVVEAELKSITLVKRAAYKKYRRQQQNAVPSLLKDSEDLNTDPVPSSSSSCSVVVEIPAATTTPPAPAFDFAPEEIETFGDQVVQAFSDAGKDNPTPKQLAEVVAALPKHPHAPREFVNVLKAKIVRIDHPGGLMKFVIPGFLRWWPEFLRRAENFVKEQERAEAIDRRARERWEAEHPDFMRELAELEAAQDRLLQGTPAGVPPQAEHHQNPIPLRKAKGA